MRVILVIISILIFVDAKSISKVKGDITECVYNKLNPSIGKIHREYNLANGIDHVLVKRDSLGKIQKCIITDSKYGSSKLASNRKDLSTGNRDMHQMSDTWILQNLDRLISVDLENSNFDQTTKNKIKKARENGSIAELRNLVKKGVCKKKVFNLDFDDRGRISTRYYEIKNIDNKMVYMTKTSGSNTTNYTNKMIDPYRTKKAWGLTKNPKI